MQNVRRVSLAARCGQALGERKKSVGMAAFERKKSVIPTRRKSEEKQAEKQAENALIDAAVAMVEEQAVEALKSKPSTPQAEPAAEHEGIHPQATRTPLKVVLQLCRPNSSWKWSRRSRWRSSNTTRLNEQVKTGASH